MDSSTETLLVILISILTIVVVFLLIALIIFLVTLKRVLNKAERLVDNSNESLEMLKSRLAKSLGFAGFLRYFARKTKR